MESGSVVLAYDLGTTNLKVAAFGHDGDCIGSSSATYPTSRPVPSAAEQDPDDWWQAACRATAELISMPGMSERRIAAIGVTGQMHGIVLSDADGLAVRPCMTWADGRGVSMVPTLAADVQRSRVLAITGNPLDTEFSATKLAWVRANEPAVWARVRSISLPKDAFRRRLTGTLVTDASDASGTGLLHLATRSWSNELLTAWGLDRDLLPEIALSTSLAGSLSSEAAGALGLSSAIPVAVGAGDTVAAAVGLGVEGADASATGMLGLGTAGQLLMAIDTARPDPRGRLNALCHARVDRWCLMAAILDGGGAMAWILSNIGVAPMDEARVTREAVARVAVGCEGLLFLPQLSGERTPGMDPQATGAFVGMRVAHGQLHFVRAVMEGVAYALREGLDILTELGTPPTRLRLGGGVARSREWAQIISDVLSVPIEVDRRTDASARGAAEIAARMIGVNLVSPRYQEYDLFEPRRLTSDRYQECYARYLATKAAVQAAERGVIH